MSNSKIENDKQKTQKEQSRNQCEGAFRSAGTVTFEQELKSKVISGKTTDPASFDCLRELRKNGTTAEGKKVLENFAGVHGCNSLGMDPGISIISPEVNDVSVELLASLQSCVPKSHSTKSFVGCMANSHDPYTATQALVARLEEDPNAEHVKIQCESKSKDPHYTEALLVGLRESVIPEVKWYGEKLSIQLKQEGNVFAKHVVDVLYRS